MPTQSVVRIRPSLFSRRNVGVPGMGTTMLIVVTSTHASSRTRGAAEDRDVVLVEAEHDLEVHRAGGAWR